MKPAPPPPDLMERIRQRITDAFEGELTEAEALEMFADSGWPVDEDLQGRSQVTRSTPRSAAERGPGTAAGRELLHITTKQPGDDWPLWDSLTDAERLDAILAIETEAATEPDGAVGA